MGDLIIPANRKEATKILYSLTDEFLTYPHIRRVGILNRGLYLQIGKNKSKANIVMITLDGYGKYDIKFSYNRKPYNSLDHINKTAKLRRKREQVDAYEGVPIDELQTVLSEVTGFVN